MNYFNVHTRAMDKRKRTTKENNMTARAYQSEAEEKSKAALSRKVIRMNIEESLQQLERYEGEDGDCFTQEVRDGLEQLVESYES